MRLRTLRRRAATAAGVYGAAVLGFLATLIAAGELSKHDLARYGLAFGTTSLLQLFVDLTIDEVVVKYGNRYAAQADWGRFHRLFRVGLLVKMVGGAAGTLAVLGAAGLAPYMWKTHGVQLPLAVASLVPLIQQPEGMAGAVLLVANRYDLRGLFLLWATALRFAAIVVGARFGVVEVFVGIVAAQAVSTASVSATALRLYRRYPAARPTALGEHAREIRRFALQSSAASALTSLRTSLPMVLAGVYMPYRALADFRIAQAPQTAFQSLSAPARLILLAEQTRDVEHGRADRAFRLLWRYIGGTLLLGAIVTPILWFAMHWLVRLAWHEKYVSAVSAFRVMLLVAVVQLVLGWTKSFPVSIGRPGLRTTGQAIEIAVLIPAVLLLGARHGAAGAATGVLAGGLALALFWVVALTWVHGRPLPGVAAGPAEPTEVVLGELQ